MKPATYNPTAREEADEAAAYYHQRNPVKAYEFLDELALVVDEIRHGPKRWPFEKGTRAQRMHLRRFPFTVYYREDLHEIYIIAVAHTSRRPGYWKSRIAVA